MGCEPDIQTLFISIFFLKLEDKRFGAKQIEANVILFGYLNEAFDFRSMSDMIEDITQGLDLF